MVSLKGNRCPNGRLLFEKNMKRKITISYKPGSISEIPMLRITNNYLRKYGFNIGDEVKIEYKQNELIIKKVGVHKLNRNQNNEYNK